MTELQKEIKKYHILGYMQVRGSGSQHGEHNCRCLWDICGKPSIQWALEAVKGSPYIDKIVVATEDSRIRDVVVKLGVTVIDRPLYTTLDFPRDYTQGTFKRTKPRSLTHMKPSIFTDTLEYSLYYLEKKERYTAELIFRAEANRPLGTTQIVNRVIEAFFKDEQATVAHTYYPIFSNIFTVNPRMNRPVRIFAQAVDRQIAFPFYSNGPFMIRGLPLKSDSQGDRVVPVYVTEEEGLDLHNREDLFRAQCYMKRRLLKEGKEVNWKIGQDYKHKTK